MQTVYGIPHLALQTYTNDRIGDGCVSGSRVHIETPDDAFDIKLRSNNCHSAFRLELNRIYKGLEFIDTASELIFKDI
ncbi:hypothetical protein TNCV_311081 [Trichonephila clavipes]|nr:hypothetical protein TNCV_311081 [Trichonephila clavipes]